jgi:PAS domain S-box-containing protein
MRRPVPISHEVRLADEALLVTKTDLQGRITYANDTFMGICGYREAQLLGQPHSLIRHPDMPRCVFAVMWETISRGEEIFAFVKNLAADGSFYWVLAHVTPTFDAQGTMISYHSSRRAPSRQALPAVEDLYAVLRAEEARHPRGPAQIAASRRVLEEALAARGQSYGQFVFDLEAQREAA